MIRRATFRILGLASAVTLTFASSALAATATIGQLFAPSGINCAFGSGGTLLVTGESAGIYPVFAPGVITSWSYQEAESTFSGLKLKVGRSAGGTSYTITGESAAGTQTPNTVNTYPADIPVQAGDLIGFYATGSTSDCASPGTSSDTHEVVNGDQAPGTTTTYFPDSGDKFPLSVQEVLQPGISSISPSSGPTTGKTTVFITGHDLSGATTVRFGGAAAESFTINSDSKITAVAPARSAPGPVDVTVTTAGGTSPVVAADKFTYSACVVPKLKGKKLKKAKKALKAADCKLGKVRPTGRKKGHVKKQKPKPGTVLAPGSKVNIRLG